MATKKSINGVGSHSLSLSSQNRFIKAFVFSSLKYYRFLLKKKRLLPFNN